MDNKRITFGNEAKLKLLKGIDIVANAVKVTLGYGGRTVVISEAGFPARTTKDGVTVAKSIKLRDEEEDAGAKLIKDTSGKVADEVGDGTTTVCVLMQSIITGGITKINEGKNPIDLKKGMELAASEITGHIKEMSVETDDRLLKAVATVSANNDEEIGGLISDAYLKLGKHGIISIEDSNGPETKIEIVEGFHFICGWFSHMFINNFAKNTCELENPYVMIVEGKINDVRQIWPIMEKVSKMGRSLVIIAEDFDVSVPTTLIRNREVFQACLIRYNFMGDTKQELMYDLCAITGAKVAERQGDKMENLSVEYLGECEKFTIGQTESLIIKGKKSEKELEARIADAKVKIEQSKNIFIKQKHEARFAKLSGALAICYVGGATEIEVSEKKDRIDDSIRATKAAIDEGVVPGGGKTLVECYKKMEDISKVPKHLIEGYRIILGALREPICQILDNNGSSVEYMNIQNMDGWFGYNAKTDCIRDLKEDGIVDPAKVVRVCIESAVSTSIQVLTSEALIVSDN